MTALQLLVLAGAATGLGLFAVVRELRPAPVDVRAWLAGLDRADAGGAGLPALGSGPGLERWLGARGGARLVSVPAADLAILGARAEDLAARKVLFAAGGAALPGLAAAAAALLGLGGVVVLPAVMALIAGAAGFFLPDAVARGQARQAREAFRRAVGSYLDLVALIRSSDGGVTDALEQPVRAAQGWVFVRIRGALDRARVSGQPPWVALGGLGEQLDVPELRDLSKIADLAAYDQTAIFDALAEKSRAIRAAKLAEEKAAADSRSDLMGLPNTLLIFGFLVILLYPFLFRLLA